ncbi:MAG: hypothetical protein WCF15_11830 [Pseudolabrys sp.]
MQRSPESQQAKRGRLMAAGLAAAGFGLTLLIFYPGIMTYDAKFVYEDIAKHTLGDWQSPVMTVLWALIDPVAPGSASMFLLIAAVYWLAFGVLGFTLAGRSARLGALPPILALLPPAFVLVGVLWRDVLFAVTWLLAGVLTFAVTDRLPRVRVPIQILAFALCCLGVLLRPNSIIAAPLLAIYIAWPLQMRWKRTAVLFIPTIAVFFGLVQLIYYGVLGATRQHPLQSIMIFDLGGISHFTKENQFPVTWNERDTALLLNGCYRPTEWDLYWRLEPCEFVMHKIETEEKLFGTPAIPKAWASAVARHPIAYLEHRASFMWNFLSGSNLTMWVADIEKPNETVFPERTAFAVLMVVHDVLKPTVFFHAGFWLLACLLMSALAWRRRDSPEGAFAIAVCGSASLYVLTFFSVGVASDFRYGYWAVLASIAGLSALLSPARLQTG